MLAHGLWKTLLEDKKIKLWNKQHLVESKTEVIQYVLKVQ